MSSVIDKLKPHKALSHGSKLPAHALKEDNPEQATVNLHEVPGKSEFFTSLIDHLPSPTEC
jgi:hypothetical protein